MSALHEEFSTELGIVCDAETDLRGFLMAEGTLSGAAARLESVQDEIGQQQANLHLLQAVGGLLPAVNPKFQYLIPNYSYYCKGALEVPRGTEQYYTARKIQASVIWKEQDGRDPHPYYVIGSSLNEAEPDETLLLLLPAKSGNGGARLPLRMPVRKDVADAYFEWAQQYINGEYTAKEIDTLIDKHTGNIVISPIACGSMMAQSRNLHAWPSSTRTIEKVQKGKIMVSSWEGATYCDGISNRELAAFGVEGNIAKLVAAFGVADKCRAILNPETAQEEVPNAPGNHIVDQLREQNKALKALLATVLTSSGFISPDQVNTMIAKKYPTL